MTRRSAPFAASLAVLACLIAAGPVLAARESPLRSFIAPPGQDDARPVPGSAPRISVERHPLPPPARLAILDVAGDVAFAVACSAAAAALIVPTAGKTGRVACADPFTVIAEQP
jgi:hypothetical protein